MRYSDMEMTYHGPVLINRDNHDQFVTQAGTVWEFVNGVDYVPEDGSPVEIAVMGDYVPGAFPTEELPGKVAIYKYENKFYWEY